MTSNRTGRKLAAALALATSLAVAAVGCSSGADKGPDGSDSGQAQTGGTLTIGVDRSPNSFDPLQSYLGGQYMQTLDPVYDTLIRMNPDGSFSPGLATEWSWQDTTSFAMTLRDDVVFADGETPFDAETVKANLDRLESVVGPQTSDLAAMYESTEVVDDTHVVVHLSSPNPALERIFSQLIGMMVNPNALGDEESEKKLGEGPQGSGPFVLDTGRTVVNDTYHFTKNPNYWDPEEFPYDELVVKVYEDQNAMLAAIQTGETSLAYGSPGTYDTAEGFGLGIATKPVNVSWLNLVGRDGEQFPALAEKKVRQAMNYAVDRDAILETIYQGQGETTDQVFPIDTPGYDPDLDGHYSFDPEKAKDLLAEAGYADGFTFSAGVAFPDRDGDLAQALASYYSKVGITMDIKPMPPGAFDADEHKIYGATVHAMGGQGAYSDTQLLFMPTHTIWNPRDDENAEFEKLWNKGTEATDANERLAAYQELSEAAVDEAWLVPLVNVNAIYYFDEDVFADTPFTPGLTVPQIHNWEFAG